MMYFRFVFYNKSKCKSFLILILQQSQLAKENALLNFTVYFTQVKVYFTLVKALVFSLKYTKTLKIQLKPFTLAFFPGRCNGLIFLYFD